MDMVMSRVDWIIKLRDIFYNLLDATQNRQTSKIRADKLMNQLIKLQYSLKLIPVDEYALSSQRHEVSVSYRTILSNLRKRILEFQRETSLLMTLGKPNASQNQTSMEGGNLGALMLQLDEVIDLPFKGQSGGKQGNASANTG